MLSQFSPYCILKSLLQRCNTEAFYQSCIIFNTGFFFAFFSQCILFWGIYLWLLVVVGFFKIWLKVSSLSFSYSDIPAGDNHPSADSWRHQVGGADNCAIKQWFERRKRTLKTLQLLRFNLMQTFYNIAISKFSAMHFFYFTSIWRCKAVTLYIPIWVCYPHDTHNRNLKNLSQNFQIKHQEPFTLYSIFVF